MENRNRASGWQYAKLSGHHNEELIKELLCNDPDYVDKLLQRIGATSNRISDISVGGLHETHVTGVINGKKTKSKTDLKLSMKDGDVINISIKKSLGGQVYFVRAGLFFETFEKQFHTIIPDRVKRAINLFWSSADDAIDIIEKYADKSNERTFSLQKRHKSLNATTLLAYDPLLYKSLLGWFIDYSYEITKLCFSMGAARDASEWSRFIWYKNLLKENDIDEIFLIEDICEAAQSVASEKTSFNNINGGTTIQLPFGFVQWHQKQMQFHHNYEKIIELF